MTLKVRAINGRLYQEIEEVCYGCNGTGDYRLDGETEPDECDICDGTGTYVNLVDYDP